MLRSLNASCPYCTGSRLYVDDQTGRVVLNPDTATQLPCRHLVAWQILTWQWTAVGSGFIERSVNETFYHPQIHAELDGPEFDVEEQFNDYLADLRLSGSERPVVFAPEAEHHVADCGCIVELEWLPRGRRERDCAAFESEGVAVFARDALQWLAEMIGHWRCQVELEES